MPCFPAVVYALIFAGGVAGSLQLTPVVAALAMLASSAFVVANARRLARVSLAG